MQSKFGSMSPLGTMLAIVALGVTVADELPAQTYMPVVIEASFDETRSQDEKEKDEVMQRQQRLLESRYDLGDRPSDAMMSAGRKAVQQGVRVKLHDGVDWDALNAMTPAQIKAEDLFPMGFRPLPHVKHAVGGMVFPQTQIDEMLRLEQRNLERFDVAFDLPDHLTPEFPPPSWPPRP